MDTLFWNKTNSNIKFEKTTKQFYSRFLWKMVVTAEAGRLINTKTGSIEEALKDRIASVSQHRYFWNSPRNRNLDKVDVEFLNNIKSIRNKTDNVKVRVEEPHIHFYAETEVDLKLICSKFKKSQRDYITTVTGPESTKAEEILRSGGIISRTETEYKHKIVLRDGNYGREVKDQVLGYLDSLGDEVKVTPGARDMLEKPYPSMWGVYFYTRDPKVTTFLSLISPRIVSNIHPLVDPDL